ncbi:sialidase-4-like [Anneissia japonica]|uniref:sialidase-4-like n=1 Tax=Anneissia japonica TaxID=1529436 RepID=UPI0014259378|nr:sialidase-4-like [Anneissia japonica]
MTSPSELVAATANVLPITEIFGQGDNEYNTFRIPALVFHNDTFLAFCEGRKQSFRDWGPMDLVMRRGFLKGDNIDWEDIKVIASFENRRTMNPVPLVDKHKNAIILVFTTYPTEKNEADMIKEEKYICRVHVIKTLDEGQTWSSPADITEETLGKLSRPPNIYSPGPGHGIQLSTGRLIVPGNMTWKPVEEEGFFAKITQFVMSLFDTFYGTESLSNVLYSDDGGNTWHLSNTVQHTKDDNDHPIHSNECQAVELEDGSICVNSRTLGTAYRQQAFSNDGCVSFHRSELTQLEEPCHMMSKIMPTVKSFGGCQASLVGFPAPQHLLCKNDQKIWVLFTNPASNTTRINMSVRLSRDGCQTWSRPWLLDPYPSAYSDITYYGMHQLPDGTSTCLFACLHESGSAHPYERIVFQKFSLLDLLQGLEIAK